MKHKVALLWFRRTLRVEDNRALLSALRSAEQVVPVFIHDPAILARPDTSPQRVAFLHAGLHRLDMELRARGSALVLRHGNPVEELPRLAAETGATAVFHSREYEPAGLERDRLIPLETHVSRDHLLVEPETITNQLGKPYTVFTPYFRVWERQEFLAPLAAPERIPTPSNIPSLPLPPSILTPPSPESVLARFVAQGMDHYETGRELLGEEGTSQLSAYVKFGMISIRRLRVAATNPAWLRQLAWRDFYYQILWNFPHVAEGCFKREYDSLAWPNDPALLAAWQEGRTGYPIVDAGMRQLRATGWMHNRARMIVASFLTKDLLCDWRLGEAWFMKHLVDGDLASNNGGWQWAAGTGTDAQPYFRIFNPVSQGEKFDPEGTYVRRWCPELKDVPTKLLHRPWEAALTTSYPARILEHSVQRAKALVLYKAVSKGVDQ